MVPESFPPFLRAVIATGKDWRSCHRYGVRLFACSPVRLLASARAIRGRGPASSHHQARYLPFSKWRLRAWLRTATEDRGGHRLQDLEPTASLGQAPFGGYHSLKSSTEGNLLGKLDLRTNAFGRREWQRRVPSAACGALPGGGEALKPCDALRPVLQVVDA